MTVRNTIGPWLITLASLLVSSCGEKTNDPNSSPETSTVEPDLSTIVGALAILTVDTDDPGPSFEDSDTNLIIVNQDNSLRTFSSSLQIETNESAGLIKQGFTADLARINPVTGDIFVILTEGQTGPWSECSILKAAKDAAEYSCVVDKTNIYSFYDNNNNNQQGQLRQKFYIKFDGLGNSFYMAQTDAERDSDTSPKIYKIPATGAANTVHVEVGSNRFIRGMDANRAGALFYWTLATEGEDLVEIKIVRPDGVPVDLPPADSQNRTTKMIFFAVDRYDGLIYCPEIHSTSHHHIYKLAFDAQYAVTQTLNMTEDEPGGPSQISWPASPKLDNTGRLFIRANESTETGDNAPHLYVFNITKTNDLFSSTMAMVSDISEQVQSYTRAGDDVFYDGFMIGDESSRFFYKRPIAGGTQTDLRTSLQNTALTKLTDDSESNTLLIACDPVTLGSCKWGSITPGSNTVSVTSGLGKVRDLQPALAIQSENPSTYEGM